MRIDNYPFTIIGFVFLVIGWFAIFTGIFGFFKAEDLLVFTLRLESMVLDTTFVPQAHIWFHLLIRIFLGIIIVIIGNSFLIRGLNRCHEGVCHPRLGDFRRLR